MAFPLAWIALAAGSPAQEATLMIAGTGTATGTMMLLASAFEKVNPSDKVRVLPSIGSSGAIKAVLSGMIGLGISGRMPTDAEQAQGVIATEYARSPLVLAVPSGLRLNDITRGQLIDIYAGRIMYWPDGTPIRLILRPAADISTITLKALSPEMSEAVAAAEKRRGIFVAFTDQDALEHLQIPGALGVTTLSAVVTSGLQVKALALDGVEPSAAALADGTYPLVVRFFLVTGRKPSALAEQFIAFVQSAAARRILSDTGHWLPEQPGVR